MGATLYREGSTRTLTIVESSAVADGPGWWLRFREIPDRAPPRRCAACTSRSTGPTSPASPAAGCGASSRAWRSAARTGRSWAASSRSTARAAPRCSSCAGRAARSTSRACEGIVTDLAPERGELIVDMDALALDARPGRGRLRPAPATGARRTRPRQPKAGRPRGARAPPTPPAPPTDHRADARDRRPHAVPADGRGAAAREHPWADPRARPRRRPRPRPARVGPRPPPHGRRLHRTVAAPGWCCGSTSSRPRSTRSGARTPTVILLDPAGEPFRQPVAHELAAASHLVFLCPRYEGVDDRVRALVDRELSIGDYVLTGGELRGARRSSMRCCGCCPARSTRRRPPRSRSPRGCSSTRSSPGPPSSTAGRCRPCSSRGTTSRSAAGGCANRCAGPATGGRTCSRPRPHEDEARAMAELRAEPPPSLGGEAPTPTPDTGHASCYPPPSAAPCSRHAVPRPAPSAAPAAADH